MRSALSISGSDPTGGTGIQADLQTFAVRGVRGAGVISALTVQNSSRIHTVLPVFPSVVIEQIRVLLSDWTPDAIKIGMLASDDVARAVLLGLASLEGRVPLVIDPVLEARDGTVVLERRGWPTLKELIRGCRLVTPTLMEAEYLSGIDCGREAQRERAARFFLEDLGAGAVLIKSDPPSGPSGDLLAMAGPSEIEFKWLVGKRPSTEPVRARGCALSSAIAAGLAQGWPLEESVHGALAFVREAGADSPALGRAASPLARPRGIT